MAGLILLPFFRGLYRPNLKGNSVSVMYINQPKEHIRIYPLLAIVHDNHRILSKHSCVNWLKNVIIASLLGITSMPLDSFATMYSSLETSEQTSSDSEEDDDADDERFHLEITNKSGLVHTLPDKICSLTLRECRFLESLPDTLTSKFSPLMDLRIIECDSLKLIGSGGYPESLKILYIRDCASLEFSPLLKDHRFASMQRLTIKNSWHSLTSFPLDLFPKVRYLVLKGCPKLVSFSVSSYSVCLWSLTNLEIFDCPRLEWFPFGGLSAPNLSLLQLYNCKSLTRLPNFMKSLTGLGSLRLYRCPKLESFHAGSLPSGLFELIIVSCDKLVPKKEWGLQNLGSLIHFHIEGGCVGIESFPEEGLLPTCLRHLQIAHLQNLKTLDSKGFRQLSALRIVEINGCDKLQRESLYGLPSSITFTVKECRLLA